MVVTVFGMSKNAIVLSNKSLTCKLKCVDILYIGQNNGNLIFSTKMRELVTPGRIDDIVKNFSDDFYRCHKYLVVNVDNVESMQKTEIVFCTGKKHYLGKNNFSQTRKAYRQYLKERYIEI